MVNLKYLVLPLLVGLFGQVIASGAAADESEKECVITENASSATPNEYCNIGIYKSTTTTKYIKCEGTTLSCSLVNLPTTETDSCEENIGKLIKKGANDYEFCLGKFGNAFPSIKLGETEDTKYGQYFVQHTFKSTNNLFTFDTDAHYYVVKLSAKGIAFDKTFNANDHCADANGKLRTRKEDFCSSGGSGLYYTCENGICKTVRDQKTYEIVKKEIEVEQSDPDCIFRVSGSTCTINNTSKCKDYYGSEVLRFNNGTAITDSSSGVIIKIEEKAESTKCEVVKAAGYYLNNDENTKEDYPLIKCNGSNCSFMEKKVGYYVNTADLSNVINCAIVREDGKEDVIKCAVETPVDNFYVNADKDLSLIKCTTNTATPSQTECTDIVVNPNTYYVTQNRKLIRCDSKDCNKLDAEGNEGYYIDAEKTKQVITCNASDCTSGEASNYYIDANDSTKKTLIDCTGTSCTTIQGKNRQVFISGGSDANKVIICNPNECEVKDLTTGTYYYINGGNNKSTKPLIKCVIPRGAKREPTEPSVPCVEYAADNDNTIFLNSNSDDEETNVFINCSTKTSCSEISVGTDKTIISIGSTQTFTYSSNWVGAPISGSGYYLINPENNEILTNNNLGSGSLVVCETTTDTEGSTKRGTVTTCSLKTTGSFANYYINKDTANSENSNILIQSKGSTLSFLEKVEIGYYINGSTDIIACTSSASCAKYDSTNFKDSCNADDILGYFSKNGLFCTKKAASPPALTTTATKYMLDIKAGGPLALELGYYLFIADSKKITINKPSSDQYYLADKTTNLLISSKDKEGDLYKCESSDNKCTKIDSVVNSNKDVGDYYPNDDSKTYSTFAKIVCTGAGDTFKCKSKAASPQDYYCLYDNKLYVCSSGYSICPDAADDLSTYNCMVQTHKSGLYYTKSDNTYLINCVAGSNCSQKKDNLKVGYYVSNDPLNPLIQCVSSFGFIRCSQIASNSVADGYYIKEGDSLIKCEGSVCAEVNSSKLPSVGNKLWYKSGESGMALTYCNNPSGTVQCVADPKPAVGWYINNTGNNLIKCTSQSGTISCSETAIVNTGYYLNAADASKLISCTKGADCNESTLVTEKSYYLNGEDKHLIYCDGDKKCTAIKFNENNKLWFISTTSTALIGCTKRDGCVEYASPSHGYYKNGDSNTSYYPLIKWDTDQFKLTDDNLPNGWYINADEACANTEKIIECKNANSCTYKAVKTTACSGLSAEFTIADGTLKWCNTDHAEINISAGGTAVVLYKKKDVIPGVDLPENAARNGAYALVKYDATSVVNTQIDGYTLYDGKLFFCPQEKSGICTEIESDNIIDGFYVDHKNKSIYRCENKKCQEQNDKNCSNSNVVKKSDGLINMCIDGNSDNNGKTVNMGELNINYLYALTAFGSFPGVEGRYFRANVSKYVVTLYDKIDEVPECDTGVNHVCIKTSDKKLYENNDAADAISASENYEVNSEYKNQAIEFDYDTNNGYFVYDTTGETSKLIKVYINPSNDSKVKYECEIGGFCMELTKPEPPIIGFDLSEDGMLKATTKDTLSSGSEEEKTKTNVVKEVIREGHYKVNNENAMIHCSKEGKCRKIDNSEFTSKGLSFEGNKLKFGDIVSDKKKSKFVFGNKNTHSKRDGATSAYGEVLELTHVSYTSSTETRNIFIDNENYMITEEEKVISKGFTCKNGQCVEIDKNGVNKYYLNTVQSNKPANAVVVCGNGSCIFKTAEDISIVPNAAYSNNEDALISCNGKYCDVVPVTSEIGLPDCKTQSGSDIILEKEIAYYRADNGGKLYNDQFCILNGKLYSYSKKGTTLNDNIYLFDITLREIDVSKVKENHINASMYYCKSGGSDCKRTFGIILNGDVYTKCDSNGCTFMGRSEETSCAINGPGNLISGFKLCKDYITENAISIIQSDTNSKYYPLNVDVENIYPEISTGNKIIVGVHKNVIYTVIEDGYILINNNLILSEKGSTGDLYECFSSNMNCNIVSNPIKGYYFTSYGGSVISYGTSVCEISGDGVQFNKNEEVTYEYKESEFPGYESGVITEISKYKINALMVDNYILLNKDGNALAVDGTGNESGNLYLCTSSIGKCSKVSIKPGYYVSGNENFKYIKCESQYCTVEKELSQKCTNAGELIYKDDYQICYSKTNSYKLSEKIGEVVKLTVGTGANANAFPEKYDYLSVKANAVIGLAQSSTISSSNDSDKYVELATCTSIVDTDKCKTGSTSSPVSLDSGYYCKKDNKLYRTASGTEKCEEVKGGDGKPAVVVLYGNKELNHVKIPDSGMPGAQMYYCNNGCRLTTGYLLEDTNNIIECDNTECKKAKKASIGGEKKGEINNSESLKVDVGLIVKGSEGYHYISGNNEFPGAEGKEAILVESGTNFHIIYKGEGYYLIDNNNKLINDEGSNSGNNNKLYLCDSNKLTCVLQSGGNGYYLNAGYVSTGATKDVQAIIVCKDDVCSIANENNNSVDIFKNTSNCNATTTGRIIRDSNKKSYSFCVNSKTKETFTAQSASVKYYILNLVQGTHFAGINLEESGDDHKEDKANILIKITNRSIVQNKISGHILLGTKNDLIENVESTGNLNYCEESKYSGESKTVQCNEVTNVKSGWYFNDYFESNKYIKCIDTSCKITEATVNNACNESGSLIFNNNEFKICKTKLKQVGLKKDDEDSYEFLMNVSYSEEFPSVKLNNTNILVNVEKYNITMDKHSGYVVVKKDDSNVVKQSSTEGLTNVDGLLYNCENTGSCVQIELPQDNWYLYNNSTGLANGLIKCENKYCNVDFNSKRGFYISGNKQMPLIQCIQQGDMFDGVLDETKKRVCKDREFVSGWYLNAEKITDKPLINCSVELGCVRESIKSNGWYLNSGFKFGYERLSNATLYPIIKCSGSDCAEYNVKLETKCTKAGDVIGTYPAIKLCKNDKESVDISKINDKEYHILNVANYDDFPYASTGIILVEITKNEIIQHIIGSGNEEYYLKDKLMYKCMENGCEVLTDWDGKMVYEEVKKILYTGSCNNGSCSWSQYNTEGYVFIDQDKKLYVYNDVENSFSSIGEVYKCEKDVSKTMICSKVTDNEKGYYYNPNHKTQSKTVNTLYEKAANGWEQSNVRRCTPLSYSQGICYISLDDEVITDDLSETKPNYISAGEMCVTANGKYYFATAEINTGIDGNNCVQLPSDGSSYYYYINNEVYKVDKFGASIVEGMNYINSSNNYIIGHSNNGSWIDDDKLNENIIKCENGECKKEKVVVCNYNIQTESCSSASTVNPGQICISELGVMYLAIEKVSTTSGKCVKYEDRYIKEDSLLVSNKLSGWKYYVINKSIYRINSDNEVETLGEGIYIIDGDNNLIEKIDEGYKLDISEKSDYKLVVCNGKGCERKTSCVLNDEFEYIYDYNNKYVLKCDPNTQMVNKIVKEGYYMNNSWNNLIKCYDSGNCKVFDDNDGMEGYYRDAGNENRMIVCKRDENKFICTTDNMIKCNYEESEGMCSSDVNLLRNSYCFFSKEDKVIGKVEQLMYVENFIRVGEKGKCISGNKNDHFLKYKKSKFLGHDERNDLIKVSKDYIVSIYEKDIGYYIIDTKNGIGITDDHDLKKTRMYVCVKNECNENTSPKSGNIYINKASSEKLVKYSSRWNVIKTRCDIDKVNTDVCNLETDSTKVEQGGIIYSVNDDNIELYDVITVGITGKTMLNNQKELKENTYLYYGNKLYFYEENKQMLNYEGSDSNYFFNKNQDYAFNLTPYRSTVNVTIDNYYSKTARALLYSGSSKGEGYYWNRADKDNLGIIISFMNIPKKVEVDDSGVGDGNNQSQNEPTKHSVFKAFLNKCSSTRKNICVNLREGQTIQKGYPCVVTEGEEELKGLYLATADIKMSSTTTNCIKYEGQTVYQYEKGKMEFAGDGTYENMIFEVNESSITPLKHNYEDDNGYKYGTYILDEKLPLRSTTLKEIKYPLICNRETKNDNGVEEHVGYKCSTIANSNGKYYYNEAGSNVVYNSGNKWKVESEKGYYFFNKDFVAATVGNDGEVVDNEIKYKIVNGNLDYSIYSGIYVNKAVTDKIVLVKYDKTAVDTKYVVSTDELKECTVNNKDNTCKSVKTDDKLEDNEPCYDKNTNKLYIVEEISSTVEGAENIMKCYTGGDTVKYVLVDSNLYQLDGLSIKTMEEGYYVLNENLEGFNNENPEYAYKFIECNAGNCLEVSEETTIEQDVILNEAGTNKLGNSLLKYYGSERKFRRIYEEGYYCLNNDGSMPTSDSTSDSNVCKYTYRKVKGRKELSSVSKNYDVVYNYAKKSEGSWIYDGKRLDDSKFTLNNELNVVQYNGNYNLDENKLIYKFYGNKLYLLKPDRLESVGENGLYLMKDEEPFDNAEWTSLSGTSEICYYNGIGCNNDQLISYRNNKYMINKATAEISIVTYDAANDEWRTVKEDGFYFFFEDEYAINAEDRRISKVYQIVNGKVIKREIRNVKNDGFYLYNDLMVESVNGQWEDGAAIVENVDVYNSRKCSAIEINELIETNEFCYNDEKGLCIPKSDITDGEAEVSSNCIFNDDGESYYHVINEKMYLMNKNSYQIVSRDGLYVLDVNNNVLKSKNEKVGTAYLCESMKCEVVNDLESQYYLNIASREMEIPSIVYYNKNSNSWSTNIKSGRYFFEKNGYPLTEDGKVEFAYEVNEKTGKIEEIAVGKNEIYISKSGPEDVMVSSSGSSWGVGMKIEKCTYDESTGVVTSSALLKSGDICYSDGKMVIIKSVTGGNSEKRNDVYSYSGVISDDKKEKVVFNEEQKIIVVVKDGVVKPMEVVDGRLIIDSVTALPFDSFESKAGEVYDCLDGSCTVVTSDKLEEGRRYVNALNDVNPLVRYVGEGKFVVENGPGYYFLNEKYVAVDKEEYPSYAYEIFERNGEVIQESIIEENIVGYFFNKAKNNNVLVANNDQYWSKGMVMRNCNIATEEGSIICKTINEGETYNAGEYCYDNKSKQIYLLTGEASFEGSTPNCIFGTNEEPKYVESSTSSNKLNGVEKRYMLIELTGNAIRIVKPGYYILDQNGHIIDNNDSEEVEMNIYSCTTESCDTVNVSENEKIVTNDGGMYELDSNGKLVKVVQDGIYFIDSNGSVCDEDDDVIGSIIRISEEGGKREKLGLHDLPAGAYINEGYKSVVAFYDGEEWKVKKVGCEYDSVNMSCSNDDIELEVGSVCVNGGFLHVIHSVNESDIKKCVKATDEKPIIFNNADGQLMKVKSKNVEIIEEEGYYAIDGKTYEALDSETATAAKFIVCNGEGCHDVEPEIASYLNRSPDELNVVQFPSGKLEEAQTVRKNCSVNGTKCTATSGSLATGDICINDRSLYLVDDGGKCYKVEKNVISYQVIDKKLYMLTNDSVVQLYDGYYFISGENRAIEVLNGYEASGVKLYICSKEGVCSSVTPKQSRYYPDYTTKVNGRFRVLKYVSGKFMSIEEDGIYKLDDESYVRCHYNNNDEVTCQEITEAGAYKSVNDDLIVCTRNDSEEVECTIALDGGYYIVDGELLDCEPNAEGSKMICEKMSKEGYFVVSGTDNLYKCVEKQSDASTAGVSRVIETLNAMIASADDAGTPEDGTPEDGQNEAEGDENAGEEGEENPVEEEPEQEPQPKDVTCSVLACVEESENEIYFCKNVGEEVDDYRWIPKNDCESGNFVKGSNDFYSCEDKGKLNKDLVDKPNDEKPDDKPSSTDSEKPTTTTEGKTTTSAEVTTTKAGDSTTTTGTPEPTAGPTSTDGKSTTSKKPEATTTTKKSAGVSTLRSIPSLTFYLILFLFSYYIFI